MRLFDRVLIIAQTVVIILLALKVTKLENAEPAPQCAGDFREPACAEEWCTDPPEWCELHRTHGRVK